MVLAKLLAITPDIIAEPLGKPVSHVSSREYHEICPQFFENRGVPCIDGPADKLLYHEFLEQEGCQDAALHVFPDADDDRIRILYPGLLQGLRVLGIHLHGMKTLMHQIFDPFGVSIGQKEFAAELGKSGGQVASKSPRTNDQYTFCHDINFGQPSESSSWGCRTRSGFNGRAR